MESVDDTEQNPYLCNIKCWC